MRSFTALAVTWSSVCQWTSTTESVSLCLPVLSTATPQTRTCMCAENKQVLQDATRSWYATKSCRAVSRLPSDDSECACLLECGWAWRYLVNYLYWGFTYSNTISGCVFTTLQELSVLKSIGVKILAVNCIRSYTFKYNFQATDFSCCIYANRRNVYVVMSVINVYLYLLEVFLL